MLRIINATILILTSAVLLFGLYKVIISTEFFPYLLIDFFLLLVAIMYFALFSARKELSSSHYTILSAISGFGLISLIISYFQPEYLKMSWNFSFSLVFLVIFWSLTSITKQDRNLLEKISKYLILLSGTFIIVLLLFKISNHSMHLVAVYGLLISTISLLVALGMRMIKKDQYT